MVFPLRLLYGSIVDVPFKATIWFCSRVPFKGTIGSKLQIGFPLEEAVKGHGEGVGFRGQRLRLPIHWYLRTGV